jgi:hypothetical protein
MGITIINFDQFVTSIKTNENSDLDWSDKNWDEAGMDAENPPNSGLEGTSAETMDYTAGDYGETSDEVEIEEDETEVDRTAKSKEETDMIKALIDDLTDRVSNLEKIKQT